MSRPKKCRGGVAAGHIETTNAAAHILEMGGNAWDAALAAMAAACVVEPVLASPGGGGFFLARGAGMPNSPTVYDFFVQTPQNARDRHDVEFFPVLADFGTAQQEFHIGAGAVGVPGMMPGMAMIHEDLASMPLGDIMEPAIALARDGVPVGDFQAYLFQVVSEIYTRTPESLKCYGDASGRLKGAGDIMKNPDLARTFEAFAKEGEALFSHGAVAEIIDAQSRALGGHISRTDLADYTVVKREPLSVDYADARLFTNPPPSTGGILVAFALRMLDGLAARDAESLEGLIKVMTATDHARLESGLNNLTTGAFRTLLSESFVAHYRDSVIGRPKAHRGTTHISVIDSRENLASVTLSNGEGCGHMVPGTGFMLNNMLGEEDINPAGFHRWPRNTRLSSMMSPGFFTRSNGETVALGSGGSNRIRTAVLQVVRNIVTKGMSLEHAIHAPRLHHEGGHLALERHPDGGEMVALRLAYPDMTVWQEPNMYFGGVHAVSLHHDGGIHAVGDPRRGGAARIV